MGVFHFKRFDVRNERSAMKVNTDGVLLGAATDVLAGDRRVLDVGTGTGTVALMIAQRMENLTSDWCVQGIDIDVPSSEEAADNFSRSPWNLHLKSVNMSLSASGSGSGRPLRPDSLESAVLRQFTPGTRRETEHRPPHRRP